ncbi:MAG: hypothetical protein ACRDEA_18660, partial [Microcystaceae cyanobacterium]
INCFQTTHILWRDLYNRPSTSLSCSSTRDVVSTNSSGSTVVVCVWAIDSSSFPADAALVVVCGLLEPLAGLFGFSTPTGLSIINQVS